MSYKKLSELVSELKDPQQSDAFVKLFRSAVRDGRIVGMEASERFTMPKKFSRRGSGETYQKHAREVVFDNTAEARKWFEETERGLARTGRSRKPKLSLEAVEAGEIDFKAMAEETRRKMQARHAHGQKLGQTRASARSKKK